MNLNRRTVLQGAASATTAGLIAGGAVLLGRPAQARPAQALRPPGALPEADFLAACVRCGLCVRDCPPQNLKLSTWGDGLARDVAIGTPWFEARDIPCEMCEQLPCVKACPTGALDHGLTDIGKPQLRLDEVRQLVGLLQREASAGDEGASALLLQLVFGVRSSEILSRQIRDLDNGGRVLWIPGGKTVNARRRLNEFSDLARAGKFRLVVITSTSAKGASLRQSLSRHDWPTEVPIHFSIVPDLITLTARKHDA